MTHSQHDTPKHPWEYGMPTEEPVCRHFGCGKRLSLQESLHGNLCLEHQPGGRCLKGYKPSRLSESIFSFEKKFVDAFKSIGLGEIPAGMQINPEFLHSIATT